MTGRIPGLVVARSTFRPGCVRSVYGLDDDVLGQMTVRFSVFDTWYRIDSWWEGTFLERISRGAFKRTIKARGPKGANEIKTLFDHGFDYSIGDKLLGDISELREDTDAAVSEVNLWDTSYNRDLLPGLKRGAYGSSFMCDVIKDRWDHEPVQSEDNPDGIPERTITEVRLYEAGPVTWPANPAATAEMNSIRSDTDRMYAAMERVDPEGVRALRSRIESIPRRTVPGTSTTPDDGPAIGTSTDPVTPDHSGAAQRSRREREMKMIFLS